MENYRLDAMADACWTDPQEQEVECECGEKLGYEGERGFFLRGEYWCGVCYKEQGGVW